MSSIQPAEEYIRHEANGVHGKRSVGFQPLNELATKTIYRSLLSYQTKICFHSKQAILR